MKHVFMLVALICFGQIYAYAQADNSTVKTPQSVLEVYTDKGLGIQMKYSPSWMIRKLKEDLLYIFISAKNPRVAITISKDPTSKTLDELPIPKNNPFGKTTRTSFAGKEAIRTDVNVPSLGFPGGGDHKVEFYVIKDGYLFSVTFLVNPGSDFKKYSALFDEVINSFEFIK